MKQIPFPGGKKLQRTDCIELNDFLELSFSDAGYFFHDKTNIFAPKADLPTAYVEKNSVIVSYPATKVGKSVTLSFLDASDKQLYTCILTVKNACP